MVGDGEALADEGVGCGEEGGFRDGLRGGGVNVCNEVFEPAQRVGLGGAEGAAVQFEVGEVGGEEGGGKMPGEGGPVGGSVRGDYLQYGRGVLAGDRQDGHGKKV